MLYLIDRWLVSGNCDLSERGLQFEKYITNFLKTEALNEFAKFSIIDRSKFSFVDSSGNRLEEEIDLVLKTETTLIIAEVKCITYPLEATDLYNSFQIIKKAKSQVSRKAQFLENNWVNFEGSLGKREGRRIEKIIVVNFPHFAGRIIEGIPIADFYLFLSYFKSGELGNVKLERGKSPEWSSMPYYDSVNSFEKNFRSFFLDPIPIKDLVSRQQIEEYEVTIQGTQPKTMSQRVIYKPRSLD
ncbi:hypothetical protein [Haliscomenobacter sp.]|uniref:hypothetical protein n=1 Tax=Haliscomenobacter sp. TaxID=2717303 RepID=UPI0035947F9A